MQTNELFFNSDLMKPIKVQYLDGNFFSQDVYGNVFTIDVFNNGVPAELAGTVSADIIRPDGGTVTSTDGNINGNRIQITFPAAVYAVPGAISIVVKISDSTSVTTVLAVVTNVYQSSTETIVDPGTILPSIQTLIDAINTAVESIPQDYSALNQNVVQLNNAVNVIDGGLYRVTGFVNKKGYNTTNDPIDINSPTTNNSIMCTYISCQAGDVFTYSGYTTSSYRGWAFLDSSGNRLSALPSSGEKTNEIITAPTGTAYVIFNVTNNAYYSVWKGALKEKQDKLTFDSKPLYNSQNPVTSNGVYDIEKAFETLNGIDIVANFAHGYGYNTTGTTIDINTPTYNSAVDCAYTACVAGDKFTYTGRGSTSYYSVAFINSEGTILSKQNYAPSVTMQVVTAPENAVYAVFNCLNDFRFSVWKGAIAEDVPVNPGGFDWTGKNVAIIGDSISTNGNYISSGSVNELGNVPEIVISQADVDAGITLKAFVTYYDKNTVLHGSVTIDGVTHDSGYTISESDAGKEITFTPVQSDVTTPPTVIGMPKNNNDPSTVVWWEVASSVFGFNPIPVCWSGSSITAHEEHELDDGHPIYECSYSWHDSQIRKCGIRTPGTTGFDAGTGKINRIAPDVIIIYRGTNDLSHGPSGQYSFLTNDLDSFPTTYPDTDTYDDNGTTKYSYVKGLRLLIKKLHDTYPESKIVLCTLNYFRRLSTTAIYTNNGTDNWLSYNNMIRRIADYEGCELIDFAKDGLTYWNAANGYYNEGTSSTAKWTHPNTAGQAFLGNRALIDMRKVNANET